MPSVRNHRLIVAALTLALTAPWASATEDKIWSADLQKLGFHADGDQTVIRWRGAYIAIGSAAWIRDDQNRRCIFAFDRNKPLLVIDSVTGKPVNADALNAFHDNWEPIRALTNFYPCDARTAYLPTGGTAMTADLRYNIETSYFVVSYIFSGKEKYRIRIPANFRCRDQCVVSNQTGTRFALLETGQSWMARIGNKLLDHVHDTEYNDTLSIKVFASQDGKKLFERTWKPKHWRFNAAETIAFSDDGEMLATIGEDGELRVFRIRVENQHSE